LIRGRFCQIGEQEHRGDKRQLRKITNNGFHISRWNQVSSGSRVAPTLFALETALILTARVDSHVSDDK
jgi:hypothetical protein